jgi:sugar phosphate isomerase/epimerase
MDKVGIDFLSAFAMRPTDLVRLAADLGCPTVSLVLDPIDVNPEGFAPWSLRKDPALRRELAAVLRDTGVSVGLGEGFIVAPDFDVKNHAADLDIMAELGARMINTISFDPDLSRSFDQFGVVVEMAASVGLPSVTEFAPVFSVRDLPTALAGVRHVGRPKDYRVLIDTMHLGRTGGTAADIAALDPDVIGYVQLSDAPLKPVIADYMEEAMHERKVPGEGELPLREVLAALPRDVIVSVEVPEYAKAKGGMAPEARIGHLVRTTQRLMREIHAPAN